MSMPVATKNKGFLCFAFPDVCKTQVGTSQPPLPYPNTGDLNETVNVSENVFVRSKSVIHEESYIEKSTGDEAGLPEETTGKIRFETASHSVFVNGKAVVRMMDATKQNANNARGKVISGDSTVFVGD